MTKASHVISQRIEPYGWDADDRTYYVLDDNRVYRSSEIPEPSVRKPKKQKTYATNRRSYRGQRASNITAAGEYYMAENGDPGSAHNKSCWGSMTWECVAVTLDDVRRLIDKFRATRDANEKILRKQLDVHLLPILEKQEESRKRKEAQHQRELLNLAKMANAKRSSRIAGKVEQQREEEKAKEQWVKAQKEHESQQRETRKQLKLEQERDLRISLRERRLEERAARRRLHEEELSQLSEGRSSGSHGQTRISDRQLQTEIDRNRRALKALEEEEEDWTFDCVCGLHGQVDDGAHSVACERCNVWQHSKCIGIRKSEAERPEFNFICASCRQQTEDTGAIRKRVIKLKVKSSTQVIRHPLNDHTTKIESQPATHSMDLDTSPNGAAVFSGLSDGQPGTSQSCTNLQASCLGSERGQSIC
ncbi:PHD finger domain-containing protein [Cordyceps javanica]|uniref:PHD finger domain-containing protein n=1 Tax=Cordyceps javanica TaxID=43265 RepID=A0A545V2R8_9HYPO|nr:PHD finger domain-containing protein [Cordyceps javanica]